MIDWLIQNFGEINIHQFSNLFQCQCDEFGGRILKPFSTSPTSFFSFFCPLGHSAAKLICIVKFLKFMRTTSARKQKHQKARPVYLAICDVRIPTNAKIQYINTKVFTQEPPTSFCASGHTKFVNTRRSLRLHHLLNS